MDENLKLKRSLILQSFAPLFLLLFIKNIRLHYFTLVYKFFSCFINGNILVIITVIRHKDFLNIVVMGICIVWIILSVCAYLQFSDFQTSDFIEEDGMEVKKYTTEAGVGFFMTFILPLVLDNFGEFQDFLVFILMISFIVILMWKTNLYYQNPILTILGYKTFIFEIKNPEDNRLKDKEYIGISKDNVNTGGIIKYRYIADDVFVVYKKNRG